MHAATKRNLCTVGVLANRAVLSTASATSKYCHYHVDAAAAAAADDDDDDDDDDKYDNNNQNAKLVPLLPQQFAHEFTLHV